MSSTKKDTVNSLIGWLNKNAYWNDICEVKPSKYGIGVFQKQNSKLKKEDILLRIPKSNILSPKNTFIYNLIVDYIPKNDEINLVQGMHGLILAVIYELSLGSNSPWSAYLESIDFFSDDGTVALCLWDEVSKSNLKNSEVDILNMMNIDELAEFYEECVYFARSNQHLIEAPKILFLKDIEISREELIEKYRHKLVDFSKIIQSVISRAFLIDEFYDLSLVPGADLFNHIAPTIVDNEIQYNENVHFVCDSNTCAFCGEVDCEDHEDEDDDDDVEEEEYGEEYDGAVGVEVHENHDADSGDDSEDGHEIDDKENGSLLDLDDDEEISEGISDVSESESSDEGDLHCSDGCNHSHEENGEDSEMEELEPITEITMDYITRMEDELDDSDTGTIQDDEEVSTLSLSEDEDRDGLSSEVKDEGEHEQSAFYGTDDDLTQELMDNSKCCDIILVSVPKKEHGYEIFNTYGNNLSNPYLLQRYGFISDNNPNNSVLISVQFFRYLKAKKSGLSKIKQDQLDKKLEWMEEVGFDILNEILYSSDDEKEPESSWEFSIKILYDGTASTNTYVLLKLLDLPWKYFKTLRGRNERKTKKRVQKYLLNYKEKAFNDIIKSWCDKKLAGYPKLKTCNYIEIVTGLVQDEKSILKKYINSH